jgi:hypothetical protein
VAGGDGGSGSAAFDSGVLVVLSLGEGADEVSQSSSVTMIWSVFTGVTSWSGGGRTEKLPASASSILFGDGATLGGKDGEKDEAVRKYTRKTMSTKME